MQNKQKKIFIDFDVVVRLCNLGIKTIESAKASYRWYYGQFI